MAIRRGITLSFLLLISSSSWASTYLDIPFSIDPFGILEVTPQNFLVNPVSTYSYFYTFSFALGASLLPSQGYLGRLSLRYVSNNLALGLGAFYLTPYKLSSSYAVILPIAIAMPKSIVALSVKYWTSSKAGYSNAALDLSIKYQLPVVDLLASIRDVSLAFGPNITFSFPKLQLAAVFTSPSQTFKAFLGAVGYLESSDVRLMLGASFRIINFSKRKEKLEEQKRAEALTKAILGIEEKEEKPTISELDKRIEKIRKGSPSFVLEDELLLVFEILGNSYHGGLVLSLASIGLKISAGVSILEPFKFTSPLINLELGLDL